jgi:hypothetical protein
VSSKNKLSSLTPRRREALLASALALGLGSGAAYAIDDVIETPEAFLTEAFGASAPQPKFLDLDDGAQSQLSAVLGHPYPQARLRYWSANGRTAWIFDDKGRDGYVPTTAGFVVEKGGTIGIVRVLIYRESHGEEVAQPSFEKQFSGAHAAGAQLDRNIDGISGATLSVKMMARMARAAIVMDSLAPKS